MARRNHSRRIHPPYGDQGVGYAEGIGGQPWAGGREEAGEAEGGAWGEAGSYVSSRPGTSLVTAFGIGFGLGLIVTMLLGRDEEEGWFERYAPDAIQDLPDRLRHAGSHLSDSVTGSLRQTGHRLSDSMGGSLRHAGESLASYVPRSWKGW